MTELATYEAPAQAAVAYVPPATVAKVDLSDYWARMGVAIQIAEPMCKTPFVPSAFRNKPEDTAMAIMYGFKYGMEPDAALSSIFIIGGRPGMYSRVQHAILMAHGHDVRVVKQTPTECVVKGRRKGDEGDWTESVWTIERARQAGYFTNEKYTKDPIAMLTARALGDVCRLVAPDLLMGIVAYNEADVEVMEVLDGDTLQPIQQPVQRSTVRRSVTPSTPRQFVDVSAPAPAPVQPQQGAEVPPPLSGEAAAESDADADVVDADDVEYDDGVQEPVEESNVVTMFPQPMASELQITAMVAEMVKLGLRTPASKRKAINEFCGREVAGPHELSADEADKFINHLMHQQLAAQPAESAPADVDAKWGLAPEGNEQ